MIETFAALLLAHALADFVLQSRWMVANKRRPAALALHGLVVLVTAAAALGRIDAWEVAVLTAAHVVIDAVKAHLPRGLARFLGDQAAHLATLIAAAVLVPDLWAGGLWARLDWAPGAMALAAGLILATRAGGFAVEFLMAPLAVEDLPRGLTGGGMLIGMLERGLIFLLVMVGQPAAIGFLIAAKSVLRFEVSSRDQRAGEYVIVGTLASFGWALATAYATLALAERLPAVGLLPASR
ncbi:Protein of unknown function [Meinhardsimonia xiamenensis]|jgi:hypothetical protein|uniref:DUF3307 domain-containing protein n=1 Tax=Meinhardsimonia xiamenensis TaxID=990712 RepID=A0A1G9FE72_9RHOB|nr:DUF3307 domain-containing protein [Meinhardsimonia xiamenensis]PRX37885.1 uncharacterized protein DUF3307 [Meinhardsimonia xiamenensis]SDK86647.1 Protein of unknown function [Meinhardsimonia xiamenensis]